MENFILLAVIGLLLLSFSPMLIILIWDAIDLHRNSKKLEQVQSERDDIINQLV